MLYIFTDLSIYLLLIINQTVDNKQYFKLTLLFFFQYRLYRLHLKDLKYDITNENLYIHIPDIFTDNLSF